MSDYIIKATAADGGIRAFAATTRDTVEKARSIHNTSPVVSAALGRLLTAGLMMGSMMKNEEDMLTLSLKGDGPMEGLLVTADSLGHVKGYPFNPLVIIPANSRGKLDVAGAIGRGSLTVISDIGLKEPYVGTVELVSGEIAEDIAYYYQTSEQVQSAVALGVLLNKENFIDSAGGFIIQLMPGCTDETIDKLQERLSDIEPMTTMLHRGMSPEDILEKIFDGMNLEINERLECMFECDCSRDRVKRALISTGRKEIQDMIDRGANVELECNFCNKIYNFSIDELREILHNC